jgi:hypothetical protein
MQNSQWIMQNDCVPEVVLSWQKVEILLQRNALQANAEFRMDNSEWTGLEVVSSRQKVEILLQQKALQADAEFRMDNSEWTGPEVVSSRQKVEILLQQRAFDEIFNSPPTQGNFKYYSYFRTVTPSLKI